MYYQAVSQELVKFTHI